MNWKTFFIALLLIFVLHSVWRFYAVKKLARETALENGGFTEFEAT